MSQQTAEYSLDWRAAIENLVTEDDEPVDNIPSAKQQRLLVTPLYDTWTPPPGEETPGEKRKFLADANIGVFRTPYDPPVVPDMFLSLDIETPFDWRGKENRSYFLWKYDKPPDVVVEIVSNTKGHELDEKLRHYARLDVSYYVVYDPQHLLMKDTLRVYERGFGRRYRRRDDYNLPDVGLSLTLWEGVYEGGPGSWIRWLDSQGNLIPTGAELATQASERAERETERAERETERAEREAERAANLAAKLRELGIDPAEI
jgi:Uma2 family endonuclease